MRSKAGTKLRKGMVGLAACALLAGMLPSLAAQDDAEPIQALFITGGGWHDFETQKKILTQGLGDRVNVAFTVDHSAGGDTEGFIERHEDARWAEEFDVVIYSKCFSHNEDEDWVSRIVYDGHIEHDIPAVLLHCAVHTFRRTDGDSWQRFMGVHSYSHEGHHPIRVESLNDRHPIMQHLETPWVTPNGELYEIVKIYDTATPLAVGRNDSMQMVAWTNRYHGVPVFTTSLGHHNETMAHHNYLNFVAAGLLWTLGKLDEDGVPQQAYVRDGFGSGRDQDF